MDRIWIGTIWHCLQLRFCGQVLRHWGGVQNHCSWSEECVRRVRYRRRLQAPQVLNQDQNRTFLQQNFVMVQEVSKYILLVWTLFFAVLTIPLFSIFVSLFDGRHLQYLSSVFLYLSLTYVTYNTVPRQYICISLWRASLKIPLFSIRRNSLTIPLFSIFVHLLDGRHSSTVCRNTQFLTWLFLGKILTLFSSAQIVAVATK